jgi:PEP-CTERM motif
VDLLPIPEPAPITPPTVTPPTVTPPVEIDPVRPVESEPDQPVNNPPVVAGEPPGQQPTPVQPSEFWGGRHPIIAIGGDPPRYTVIVAGPDTAVPMPGFVIDPVYPIDLGQYQDSDLLIPALGHVLRRDGREITVGVPFTLVDRPIDMILRDDMRTGDGSSDIGYLDVLKLSAVGLDSPVLVDGSGMINVFHAGAVVSRLAATAIGNVGSTPEPSSLVLLGLAALTAVSQRLKR